VERHQGSQLVTPVQAMEQGAPEQQVIDSDGRAEPESIEENNEELPQREAW
jgi:hypothetical protein